MKREGIELAGSFAATVNADLRVGTVEETITVTGEAPVVDIQNTTKQAVMTREILDAIPAGRNHRLFAVLIPGMSGGGGDVGGQNALSLTSIAIHGGRGTDQRLKVDGTSIRNTAGEGWSTNFIPDMSSTQEVTIDYASGSAENVTSGVTFNYIPREGSNRYTMSIFATGVNSSFQGDNYSQELADAGLGARNKLHTLVDLNPSTGGPILRDRLWFYAAARRQVNKNYVAGLWYNQNAGDAHPVGLPARRPGGVQPDARVGQRTRHLAGRAEAQGELLLRGSERAITTGSIHSWRPNRTSTGYSPECGSRRRSTARRSPADCCSRPGSRGARKISGTRIRSRATRSGTSSPWWSREG